MDMYWNESFSEMALKPFLLRELHSRGFVSVEDLSHLSSSEILQIPGMGGADWRKIAHVLNRSLTVTTRVKDKS